MNSNEFENSMKRKLQEQQFVPGEDMWLRLQADLQKKPSAKKNLIFLAPLKMAAAVLLVALGTMAVYLINNNNDTTTTQAITGNKTATSAPSKAVSQPNNQPETIVATTVNPDKAIATQKNAVAKPQIPKNNNSIAKVVPDTAPAVAQSNNMLPAVAGNKHINENPGGQLQREERNNFYADNNTNNPKPLNIGLLANVGSSTVGDVSYQIGVMGRSDLSKAIFVEVGLTLASNTVSNSNQYSFPGVSMSNDGLQNSSEKNNTNIKANYARNVISVGFTPSVGIKASKRLSFSTGAALNRNLNPTLTLTNESDIESAALANNIINTSQKVADWDIGLTCAAGYKVTKQLSFNVNYRKGLTSYLQQDNKQLKNSGVQLGLKFIFGKQ